eukprot:4165007-Pleurochrysis_carterae.AAC.2
MCHVHPLSTTKPTLRCPQGSRLLRRRAFRRALEANMTRAFDASGVEMIRGRCVGARGAAFAGCGDVVGANGDRPAIVRSRPTNNKPGAAYRASTALSLIFSSQAMIRCAMARQACQG